MIRKKLADETLNEPNDLFSFLFWRLFFAYFPLGVFFGILSLFKVIPVIINDEPHYGVLGLLIMMVYGLFFPLLMGGVLWFFLKIGGKILRVFTKI